MINRLPRQVLLTTFVLCLGGPAGSAFALPGMVESTPTKVKDYAMRVQASPGVITVAFTRNAAGSTQSHFLSTYKVSYHATNDLSSATLTGEFSGYGRIAMHFRATGPKRKLLPLGCKGKAPMTRPGVLTGNFSIKLDSNYFQTVSKRRLNAVLSTPAANYTCLHMSPPMLTNSVLTLAGLQPTRPLYTVRIGQDASGRITQVAALNTVDNAAGIVLSRTIVASAKSGILTTAPDATSGQAQGIAPFFGGTLEFNGNNYGNPDSAIGKFSGSFVAKFDSGGPQSFPAGTAGLLKNLTPTY